MASTSRIARLVLEDIPFHITERGKGGRHGSHTIAAVGGAGEQARWLFEEGEAGVDYAYRG